LPSYFSFVFLNRRRPLALKTFLNLPIHTTRTPPVDPAPAAIIAALAMHTGHISFSLKNSYADCALCTKVGGSSALGPQLAGTGTSNILK
jgi:hypothetical protein